MGKGDKKSKKGKIHIGSYGVTRPRKHSKHKHVVSKKSHAHKEAAGHDSKEKADKKPHAKKTAKSSKKD